MPAALVYSIIADYRQHHPRILPDAFSTVVVRAGGRAGTEITFDRRVAGASPRLRRSSTCTMHRGPVGALERWLSAKILGPLYDDELKRIAEYASRLHQRR